MLTRLLKECASYVVGDIYVWILLLVRTGWDG